MCGEQWRLVRGRERKELVYVFFFHPVTQRISPHPPTSRVKLNTISCSYAITTYPRRLGHGQMLGRLLLPHTLESYRSFFLSLDNPLTCCQGLNWY